MARSVRDAKLDTRAAREKLSARGKPYFRTLDPGLHLGYRKLKGTPGRWVVRFYIGEQAYTVETIATADDLSTANGVDVLDFRQAQAEARKRRDARAQATAGHGPFTVADAIAQYVEALAARGKKTTDTEFRARSMILPELGSVAVVDLTTERIRNWFMQLASKPPRLRTAKDEAQRYRAVTHDQDAVRRRRSSANRIGAILKAALTHAWREGRVESDQAWRRVKLFENVASARVRYITIAEGKRLINACAPDFRNLVRAALETGCRYGELARLQVHDFNPDAGTVAIRQSKSGKSRHVVVTEEGAAFFAELCAGRSGDEPLLRRSNGETWGASNQTLPMNEACRRAGISPHVNFHALRHTYASHAIMGGAPLHVVGKNLGHADTRMVEKHYGHLAQSYVADAIRAAAPRFGIKKDRTVVPIS
jgi:integrase